MGVFLLRGGLVGGMAMVVRRGVVMVTRESGCGVWLGLGGLRLGAWVSASRSRRKV